MILEVDEEIHAFHILFLENKEITDQKAIAEKFNEFYVNVRPNLASKILQNNNDYNTI